MELGVHMPLFAPAGRVPTARDLADYAALAERLGYAALVASDRLLTPVGWLDGLAALTIAAAATERLRLVTSVLLPALRQPAVVAKALGTLDILSRGRVIAGVGAGVSAADFALCAVPFAERWQRLDTAVATLRRLWGESPGLAEAAFLPPGLSPGGPPIWIGSWGSAAGLRRAARLGDGWIASAMSTSPVQFAAVWQAVQADVRATGKDPSHFPNAISSLFFYLTAEPAEAATVIRDVLAPALGRAPAALEQTALVGPADICTDRILQYEEAGAQHLFLWPISDPARQIQLFAEEVFPRVRV